MKSLRTNDRVSHVQYGAGSISDLGASYTVIAFDDGSVRKFVTALVQLERSDVPPPVRPVPAARRSRAAARPEAAKRNG